MKKSVCVGKIPFYIIKRDFIWTYADILLKIVVCTYITMEIQSFISWLFNPKVTLQILLTEKLSINGYIYNNEPTIQEF